FKEEYHRRSSEIVIGIVVQQQRDLDRAGRTLRRLLRSKDERVQLAAAKAIEDSTLRSLELVNLAARLDRVEAMLEGRDEAADGQEGNHPVAGQRRTAEEGLPPNGEDCGHRDRF